MFLLFNRLTKNLKLAAHLVLVAALTLTFTVSDFSNLSYFKANSFGNVKHAPFDGLVYPYLYGADWVSLSGSEREMAYTEIPSAKKIEPLRYNASELAIPSDSLGFSRSDDVRVRNAKITYSVPYMGTYKLEGIEGNGSHAAVDIKLPVGTPILAIGNGVVVKAENQEWGFGKHIVVRHNEFPSFENPAVKTTYFSSYNHLDSFSVSAGDVVKKGQIIGLSGDTGTASTPHLHFQIDKPSALWHPYWPFTTSEATAAGLNFFEAVNAGLGAENAKQHTIHPLLYVQNHLNGVSGLIAEVNTDSVVTPTDSFVTDVNLQTEFKIEAPADMILGESYNVGLKYKAVNGFASIATDQVEFKPSLVANYSLPGFFDFSDGEVLVPFTPKELGEMNIAFRSGAIDTQSGNISVRLFSDVSNNDPDLKSIKLLKDKGIVNGFDDKSFKPDEFVNKAQAAKLIVESLPSSIKSDLDLEELSFTDTKPSDWYYEYVQVLVALGAVDTNRPSFEAAKTVNLAEYLKMMYSAMQIDLNPTVDSVYSSYYDINQWFAMYLQEALKAEIINVDDAMNAGSGLKRRDTARIMASLIRSF